MNYVLIPLLAAVFAQDADKESKLEHGSRKEWQKKKDEHKKRSARSHDDIVRETKKTVATLEEKWETVLKLDVKLELEIKEHESIRETVSKIDNQCELFRKDMAVVLKGVAHIAATFDKEAWEETLDALAGYVDTMQDLSDTLEKEIEALADEFEAACEELEDLLDTLDDLMDEWDGTVGDDDDDYDDWDDED
jgi:chromosome segregation ATPase